LAFDQLAQASGPLTPEQLRQKLIASGGDATFLKENMAVVLQQMNLQGQLTLALR
jgi:hypothetical protein